MDRSIEVVPVEKKMILSRKNKVHSNIWCFLGGFTYFCSQTQRERAGHPSFSRVPTSQEDFESNDTWQLSAQDQTH